MITYQKLFNNPGKLLRLTGVNTAQFSLLVERLKPLWMLSINDYSMPTVYGQLEEEENIV